VVHTSSATVAEIQLDYRGNPTARLVSPSKSTPAPGQYLLACDDDCLFPNPLFFAGTTKQGFLIAPPIPPAWKPGTVLSLRGPLGRGFHLPAPTQHLTLAALGNTVSRILPVGISALEQDIAVTLYADPPLPPLPPSLEAYPLSMISESLQWADFLILDLPIENLSVWRNIFGTTMDEPFPHSGQALVVSAMPCGGLADCGVCAISVHHSWKFCCKDGPVFNLEDI
jgi:hypothetical protein